MDTKITTITDYVDVLNSLLDNMTTRTIIIDTLFTIHYIERLPSTERDRGQYKWVVETKASATLSSDDEASRSHVNEDDQFPRYYYLKSTLVAEVMQFIIIRALTILNIISPKA